MKFYLEIFSIIARLITGIVFIYASYDKIWEPNKFAFSVAQYELVPYWLVNPISIIIAWLEFILGIMLFLGIYTRLAATWASLLLILFTGIMIYAGIIGIKFNCGCFPNGISNEIYDIGLKEILRDLFFLIFTLWLSFNPGHWGSIKS